jgi:hypothetical protein
MSHFSSDETWTVEGDVVRMEARTLAKRVQGRPAATQVALRTHPDVVHRGAERLSRAAWQATFAACYRPKDGLWVFRAARLPGPELLPAGTRVRATVGDKGFLLDVQVLQPAARPAAGAHGAELDRG